MHCVSGLHIFFLPLYVQCPSFFCDVFPFFLYNVIIPVSFHTFIILFLHFNIIPYIFPSFSLIPSSMIIPFDVFSQLFFQCPVFFPSFQCPSIFFVMSFLLFLMSMSILKSLLPISLLPFVHPSFQPCFQCLLFLPSF